MKSVVLLFMVFLVLPGCKKENVKEDIFAVALENGRLANESFVRSLRCVKAWMEHRDSLSGLIPSNLTGKKNL